MIGKSQGKTEISLDSAGWVLPTWSFVDGRSWHFHESELTF
jgi:hypothetical protein